MERRDKDWFGVSEEGSDIVEVSMSVVYQYDPTLIDDPTPLRGSPNNVY